MNNLKKKLIFPKQNKTKQIDMDLTPPKKDDKQEQ